MNYNYPYYPQSGGITWVQGEAGAKSFYVGAGQQALLMDSEEPVFYIKSVDINGMPQPLRVFDFKERVAATPSQTDEKYATMEEVKKYIDEVLHESTVHK